MKQEFRKLMREQVQESLEPFSGLMHLMRPRKGWIRAIRDSLGLSSNRLAKLLGCTQGNITKIEKSEQERTISLMTLDKVAEALRCKVVYCLVPEESLDAILEQRARAIARKKIRYLNHSMILEGQGLTPKQLQQQEDNLVDKLLHENPKNLWIDYDN